MDINAISDQKLQQYQYEYAVKVTAKALDMQKQQGENVLKLLNSADQIVSSTKVDVYA